MVEMYEILDGRLGKCSVEQVRYVINNLLHLVIVKYGVISLVLCISTRLRFVTILSLLEKLGCGENRMYTPTYTDPTPFKMSSLNSC